MGKWYKVSRKKRRFLLNNLGKGLLWLAVIVILFVLIKRYIPVNDTSWIYKLYDKPLLVYLIFLASEVIVGIIPPEIFMIWALKSTTAKFYVVDIILLSSISYLAGILGYFIGKWFHDSRFYAFLHGKYLYQYERFLRKFGGFLVIVAAATPLPFSGICILVGSVKFSFRKFLLFAAARFIRFALYGYIIWQANTI